MEIQLENGNYGNQGIRLRRSDFPVKEQRIFEIKIKLLRPASSREEASELRFSWKSSWKMEVMKFEAFV